MDVKKARRAATMGRVLESTAATVLSGVILWWVTSPMSRSIAQSSPAAAPVEMLEMKTALPPAAAIEPSSPPPPPPARDEGGPGAATRGGRTADGSHRGINGRHPAADDEGHGGRTKG